MEFVHRRRNNCLKQSCLGNWFIDLESRKNVHDHENEPTT